MFQRYRQSVMPSLSAFPITSRWPAKHPDRLQLYSLPTPNGVKVSIMLEEIGLPYEPHTSTSARTSSWTREFLSLNPNGKIPGDHRSGRARPASRSALFESGAILHYLADKTGKLMPADPARALRDDPVGAFPDGGVGPMFGQVGFFNKFAGREYRGQAAA